MTAIRHVLEDVAAGHYVVSLRVVRGLEVALDAALHPYVASSDGVARWTPSPP